MDPYKILGLARSATKEEIKAAFRRCALEFHPDRHSQSSEAARDRAVSRFKQASEAYEVLIDDRKRATYDRGGGPFGRRTGSGYEGTGRNYGYGYGYGGGGRAPPEYGTRGGVGVEWDALFRYLTGRRFALNAFYTSALLCGIIVIERTGEALWEINNSGKSFEEAMESLEKVKTQKGHGQSHSTQHFFTRKILNVSFEVLNKIRRTEKERANSRTIRKRENGGEL